MSARKTAKKPDTIAAKMQDDLAAKIASGELSATASLVDVLTAQGVAMPNRRNRIVGAIMGFVFEEKPTGTDGRQDANGRNGADFRRDNPELCKALADTFNGETPLFGFRRYPADKEERARALLFSPLAAFYNLPTTAQGGTLKAIGEKMDAMGAAMQEGFDAARQDIANVGDDVCDTIGRERIPPKPKEVAASSRRELYNITKRITKKRGNLETFIDKATWRFRGYTVREIYKDADGLRKFINAERMAIKREENGNE